MDRQSSDYILQYNSCESSGTSNIACIIQCSWIIQCSLRLTWWIFRLPCVHLSAQSTENARLRTAAKNHLLVTLKFMPGSLTVPYGIGCPVQLVLAPLRRSRPCHLVKREITQTYLTVGTMQCLLSPSLCAPLHVHTASSSDGFICIFA